eukprot:9500967-Pyramimonas_sp.AAC.3
MCVYTLTVWDGSQQKLEVQKPMGGLNGKHTRGFFTDDRLPFSAQQPRATYDVSHQTIIWVGFRQQNDDARQNCDAYRRRNSAQDSAIALLSTTSD